MPQSSVPSRRRPWVGLLVLLVIILSIVGFGVCKRKGGRKPPPIPPDTATAVRVPARVSA